MLGVALVMVFAFPGNSDPVPVPIDLLELFRALTMVGHFLTWSLLAVGVALALMWHERSAGSSAFGVQSRQPVPCNDAPVGGMPDGQQHLAGSGSNPASPLPPLWARLL